MFGLGIGEFVFILVVALLVLGPQQLPKLARQMGRATREFKRAAQEFQNTLSEVDIDKEVEEYKSQVETLKKDVEKSLEEPKVPVDGTADEPFQIQLPEGVVSQHEKVATPESTVATDSSPKSSGNKES